MSLAKFTHDRATFLFETYCVEKKYAKKEEIIKSLQDLLITNIKRIAKEFEGEEFDFDMLADLGADVDEYVSILSFKNEKSFYKKELDLKIMDDVLSIYESQINKK